MRLPLALKIVSSDILHKTEIGGVKLAITSPEDAAAEAGQMAERIARAAPDARLDGFLLSEMAPPGVELILGTRSEERRVGKEWSVRVDLGGRRIIKKKKKKHKLERKINRTKKTKYIRNEEKIKKNTQRTTN